MPGFELFGEEERKEVNEVLSTGILMRYGFDAARKISGNHVSWNRLSATVYYAGLRSLLPVGHLRSPLRWLPWVLARATRSSCLLSHL